MHRNAQHSRHSFGFLTCESSRAWVAVPVVLLCLTISFPHSAWAQLYSGSLAGVVTDPSGAVVPGAKVTAFCTRNSESIRFTHRPRRVLGSLATDSSRS
jgi:hypothetical protein